MLANFWESICEFFADPLVNLIQWSYDIWNLVCEYVYGLLLTSPETFRGGSAWGIVSSLNPYFTIIGSSLVSLFFLISFCSESINIRQDFTWENTLKMFIKFILAQALVQKSLAFMQAFFSIATALVSIVGVSFTPVSMPDNIQQSIDGLGVGWLFVGIIIALVIYIVNTVLSIMLAITVYHRFFKLYLIIPLAPLSLSTLAGGGGLAQSGISYIKTFLNYTLEVVVIALALVISSALMSSGSGLFGNASAEGFTGVMYYMLEITFTISLTTASVKGAEGIVKRAFGL